MRSTIFELRTWFPVPFLMNFPVQSDHDIQENLDLGIFPSRPIFHYVMVMNKWILCFQRFDLRDFWQFLWAFFSWALLFGKVYLTRTYVMRQKKHIKVTFRCSTLCLELLTFNSFFCHNFVCIWDQIVLRRTNHIVLHFMISIHLEEEFKSKSSQKERAHSTSGRKQYHVIFICTFAALYLYFWSSAWRRCLLIPCSRWIHYHILLLPRMH